MEYLLYTAEIDPDVNSDLQVSFIALVDKPAIEKNFEAFNATKQACKLTIADESKRIISGPAMIADLPIYRHDKDGLGEYYVVFGKEAIQCIVEKFSAKGYLQNFNLFHDAQKTVSDVTIFNSFVTDSTLGITAPEAFKDLPEGSWFITAKVNNNDVWEKIKDGTLKGFSVEGLFNYVPVAKIKMTSEQLFNRINNLLTTVEIID